MVWRGKPCGRGDNLDAQNEVEEKQEHQREKDKQYNREHNLSEETDKGSNVKTIEVEISDQEEKDTINDEVKTIDPTN